MHRPLPDKIIPTLFEARYWLPVGYMDGAMGHVEARYASPVLPKVYAMCSIG